MEEQLKNGSRYYVFDTLQYSLFPSGVSPREVLEEIQISQEFRLSQIGGHRTPKKSKRRRRSSVERYLKEWKLNHSQEMERAEIFEDSEKEDGRGKRRTARRSVFAQERGVFPSLLMKRYVAAMSLRDSDQREDFGASKVGLLGKALRDLSVYVNEDGFGDESLAKLLGKRDFAITGTTVRTSQRHKISNRGEISDGSRKSSKMIPAELGAGGDDAKGEEVDAMEEDASNGAEEELYDDIEFQWDEEHEGNTEDACNNDAIVVLDCGKALAPPHEISMEVKGDRGDGREEEDVVIFDLLHESAWFNGSSNFVLSGIRFARREAATDDEEGDEGNVQDGKGGDSSALGGSGVEAEQDASCHSVAKTKSCGAEADRGSEEVGEVSQPPSFRSNGEIREVEADQCRKAVARGSRPLNAVGAAKDRASFSISDQWECKICTLLNDQQASVCDACKTPRHQIMPSKGLGLRSTKQATLNFSRSTPSNAERAAEEKAKAEEGQGKEDESHHSGAAAFSESKSATERQSAIGCAFNAFEIKLQSDDEDESVESSDDSSAGVPEDADGASAAQATTTTTTTTRAAISNSFEVKLNDDDSESSSSEDEDDGDTEQAEAATADKAKDKDVSCEAEGSRKFEVVLVASQDSSSSSESEAELQENKRPNVNENQPPVQSVDCDSRARRLSMSLSSSVDSYTFVKSGIRVGDKVEAKFDGQDTFYPGKVSKCNTDGSFSVNFDDGDADSHVKAEDIRKAHKKRVYFSSQDQTPTSVNKVGTNVRCDICLGQDSFEDDPIVLCDGRGNENCQVSVHKSCYGIREVRSKKKKKVDLLFALGFFFFCLFSLPSCSSPLTPNNFLAAQIPKGSFLCNVCSEPSSEERAKAVCAFCKINDGSSLIKTEDKKWVHHVCMFWHKEYHSLPDRPWNVDRVRACCPERAHVKCVFCGKGEAMECFYGNCVRAAHPHCARTAQPMHTRWLLRTRCVDENEGSRWELFCDCHHDLVRNSKGKIQSYTEFGWEEELAGVNEQQQQQMNSKVTLTQCMKEDSDEDDEATNRAMKRLGRLRNGARGSSEVEGGGTQRKGKKRKKKMLTVDEQVSRLGRIKRMQRGRAMASKFIESEAGIDSDEESGGFDYGGDGEDSAGSLEDFINDSSDVEASRLSLDDVDPDNIEAEGILHRQLDAKEQTQFTTPILRRRRQSGGRLGLSGGSDGGLGEMHFIRSVIDHHNKGGECNAVESEYLRLEQLKSPQEVNGSSKRSEKEQCSSDEEDDLSFNDPFKDFA